MKMADDIIRELWTIKDAIATEYGCDLKALVAHLRSKTREGDKQVVDLRSVRQTAQQTTKTEPDHAAQI
jgi:hypothetical protein